jgi:hypothetical protein
MRGLAIFVAVVLAGCASLDTLPPLERTRVECAVKALSGAKGVRAVAVETGLGSTPLIIRYAYSGSRRSARLKIDRWAPPGDPIDYDFEIIGDDAMPGVRELMFSCGLGQTVISD